MNLLELKNVSISFPTYTPVHHVSLTVEKGEFVGLVGPSGCGKSSLARGIMSLDEKSTITGTILFENREITNLSPKEHQKLCGGEIAMVFQDPLMAFNPLHPIGKQVLESLALHTKNATKTKVYDLLEIVGLTRSRRIYKSYPYELSGGQRQRAFIAMALAGNPKLLIADEPTTALDVTTQKQIILLLKHLQETQNLSILFITHDIRLLSSLTDKIYYMNQGKLEKKSPFVPNLIPRISSSSDKEVLKVQDLSVSYKQGQVVAPCSFSLKSGENLGILGESGSGKTTLCKAINALIPATGQVFIHQKSFLDASAAEKKYLRSFIQMVFQNPISTLNPRHTIKKMFLESLSFDSSIGKITRLKRIITALKDVSLPFKTIRKYPHELSGGEAARVALARCLLRKPEILILDEITSSLDVQTKYIILNLLTKLQQKYHFTYIFISHDIETMISITDTVFIMKDGKIVERLAKNDISKASHPYTKELLKSYSFIK